MIWLAAVIVVFAGTLAIRLLPRKVVLHSGCDAEKKTLVVLVPVLNEQSTIRRTLEHFASVQLPTSRYRIVVVTTEAERHAPGTPTTMQVVDRAATDINTRVGFALIRRIHYPYVEGVMAHQLNYGVRYLFEAFEREIDPENTVVGVFNADSQPTAELLREALERVGENAPVAQATSEYFVPDLRAGWSSMVISVAAAIWQTRWSLGVEYWRLRWQAALFKNCKDDGVRRSQLALLSPNAYVVGHGLFVRLRELIEINYLPTFAPNEDAALGYLLPLYGVSPLALQSEDRAEVPVSPRQLFNQQAGWIVGPACAADYYRYAIRNSVGSSHTLMLLQAAKVYWDALVWTVGPCLFLACLLMYLLTADPGAKYVLGAFLVYLWVPSLLLFRRSRTICPSHRPQRTLFFVGVALLPVFYLLHGLGGAVGLLRLAASRITGKPYVKYKTQR